MSKKMLRLLAVKEKTGLSRSTIYAMIKDGNFPKNFILNARAVGWLDSDIQNWIESKTNANQSYSEQSGSLK
jgi:prophage regulatory protein